MLKKTLTLALVALLLQTTALVMTIPAAWPNEKDAARARRVKQEVMGLGKQASVKVKLTDETTLEGHISEISADYFVLTDARSNTPVNVAYREVRQVKRNNLSKGAKIGIGVAIAVGVGILIAAAASRNKEPEGSGNPCVQPAQVGVPCPPGCICIQ
ncbi:MAG: hypothetical protein LC731_02835 [Acidobacteria bacterium]|nr:hypothetical protein [Acidobacteriota bacterium]